MAAAYSDGTQPVLTRAVCEHVGKAREPAKKLLIRGQALTTMPSYRRIHTLTAEGASDRELDVATWLPMYVEDAWQVQARAMLHVCGPSSWKYSMTGARVCRQHCTTSQCYS